ncbi:UPF0489 family protein [Peptostreptococcus canis]|uniref:Uncharacterized protein n=1 Tax=Peptostreptococcus canis TaxID=1159213 RepID=A0ABR6TNF0_9FIRM|nr:UPF0489 family protein [Peptostreptococcus canis]MBC2576699.1 hypothetical protein [Peptostreptococcus canis]MBP1998452.1 hypothetical protein [Peptostreptococcus canis]
MSYGGFYIEKPVGNNMFSFEKRKVKKIYVPQLVRANFNDIEIGEIPNFVEIEDGLEKACMGLKNMYEIVDSDIYKGKKIYVFDNHNHSFFFWCKLLNEGIFEKGITLVHVDQHKDMREPLNFDVDIFDLEDVKRYTNEVLNVGNFIKPAIYHDIFSNLVMVDSSYGMELEIPGNYVLDLDLDFFSKDMDYIDFEYKLYRVREYIENADIITIATSPYFIEQDRAIKVLKMLFRVEKIDKL